MYEKAIRWGEVQSIYAFRKPGEEISEEVSSIYSRIKVSGYDVLDFSLAENANQATQLVEISYYFHDDVRVNKIRDKQVWEYDSDAGRWFIVSALPMFN